MMYRNLFNSLLRGIKLPQPTSPIFQFPIPTFQHIITTIADIFVSIPPDLFAIAFIFSIAGIFLYIKIKYPFWNIQPVYHTYDFWRKWSSLPFVIHKIPVKTRYTDKSGAVDTFPWEHHRFDRTHIQTALQLIRSFRIPSERILFDLQENEFTAYFIGHNSMSYISFFNDTHQTLNSIADIAIKTKVPVGVCTSRPATLYIDVSPPIRLYMVDFLCSKRDRPIRHNLFQTHEYNIRILNPEISVSILRQDNKLCDGVIPLVQFDTRTYPLQNQVLDPLPSSFYIVEVFRENTDILHNIWNQIDTMFDLFSVRLVTDLGSIFAQIKTRGLRVFALKQKNDICCVYFIRNSRLLFEENDGKNTLDCVASICNINDHDVFYKGFMYSLRDVLRNNGNDFGMLSIDLLGHNTILSTYIESNTKHIFQSIAGYYLYNMVFPKSPIPSNSFLAIL